MNEKNNAKSIISLLIIIGLLFGSVLTYLVVDSYYKDKPFSGQSVMQTIDVVGTESVPQEFVATGKTTTTVAVFIGPDIDIVDLNLHAITASSTPGHETSFSLFQTSDAGTDGCASTTDSNLYWVDVTPITSTSKSVSTTTYGWLPNGVSGVKYQLTNWNGLCLKMELGSASTTMWVSANLKGER